MMRMFSETTRIICALARRETGKGVRVGEPAGMAGQEWPQAAIIDFISVLNSSRPMVFSDE